MPSSHSPGRLRAVLCAALAVGCTLGQATRADSRDFLWKVSGATGAVYLRQESVHLLNKDFYPLSDGFEGIQGEVRLARRRSDLTNSMAPQAQLQMLSRGMLPRSPRSTRSLSPSTFDFLSKRVARLGRPVEPLKRFKPWLLALTLAALE